jgi:hypothetical protein
MRYETDADLAKEKAAEDKIYSSLGWYCMKLGEAKYRVDWGLFDDLKMIGWGEFKFRNVPKDRFPTLLLSADKWMRLLDLSETAGLKSFMFVQWADSDLHCLRVGREINLMVKYTHGGNYARNHSGDIEPVVHIPINLFEPV